MKITILGSGTLFLTKKRFPSAFLLETKKTKMLIDCGHGALGRLAEQGIDYRNIDIIFISHFHTDHFGDAFNLVHSRFVGDLYEKKKHRPLIFIGPSEIEQRFKEWREIFWLEPKENYPIKFYEGEMKKKFKDLTIETFPIKHVPWFKSIGIKIKNKNRSVVYPGDFGSTNKFEYLVKKFKNVDLLLIEAGYPKETPNHFSFNRIEELARMAKVRKTVVVHIKPLAKEAQQLKELIKRAKLNISLAKDGMVIKI